jgi:hypothetical protein
MTETFASLGPDCFFFCNRIFEEDFLWSLVSPFGLLVVYFLRRAHQKSSRSFPRMLVFCWLFLFLAKVIWNRANVREVNNNSGVFWGRRSDCLVRVCGYVPLVVGGSCAILEHGAEISSKQLVMFRWDSSRVTLIKHVTVAEKKPCFPEPVCSNSCCGRFQVSAVIW